MLSRLDGSDHRVLGSVKVFGRVRVLGRIAATNVSAFKAQAKMHPGIPGFQALLAAIGPRFDFWKVLHMRTTLHLAGLLSKIPYEYNYRGCAGDEGATWFDADDVGPTECRDSAATHRPSPILFGIAGLTGTGACTTD
jgi:hypothetical protein